MVMKIIHDIVVAGKQISMKLFEDLDKDTVLNIYNFLSTYKNTLHFSKELLDKIRQLVLDKYDSVEIYKLNPSINDLLENNLYKLYIDEELFLVPLWHSENYFDSHNKREIIVICEPELPSSMHMDDDNNLYVDIEIRVADLQEQILHNGDVCVEVGTKKLVVPLSRLYMKTEQCYRIKKQGISKVKKDIYDISDKSDIIVHVVLV
jgi:hypothetical protein